MQQINLVLFNNCVVFLLFICSFARADESPEFKKWILSVREYKAHYALKDVFEKKVDNQGNGNDSLYGVRNFRAVLDGVYYRGGANNVYNKLSKRDNHNPLQPAALTNLCKENFGTSIYFYPTNADTMQKTTTCESSTGKNSLSYIQKSALEEKNQLEILKLIHDHIIALDVHPIYGHCWNGWHASGVMAALTLMQFCKVSNDKALDYWMKNTDGNNKKFDKIKKRIKTFKPIPELLIDEKYSREICPAL